MPDPVAFKYRAFLSYSHTDAGWARWLHAKLEGFRIDKDLVGRETATGQIPKTLRPIFRDRDDFTAGHTLNEQTLAALGASAALIVLCSPSSAKSHYVDEELRLFKSRHPDRPVIPVIVGGTPHDAKDECFAPALKFKIGRRGKISAASEELLAADVREEADGRDLALAKTVARLLDLSTDDVFRRAERERHRQTRIRSTVALVIAGLMAAGGFLAWQSHQRQQTIAGVEALVAKYSVADTTDAAVPGGTESLTAAITAIAEGAAGDARYAKALELLKAGKPAEAEPLLKAVAEEKEKRATRESKQAAAAYENLGAITGLSDPKRARDAYAKAAALDPDNAKALYWNGRLQFEAGNLDASEQAYKRLLTLTWDEGEKCATCWASFGLGDVAMERGQPSEALKYHRDGLANAESFAKAHLNNVESQTALGAAYDRMGDALLGEGKLTEALKSYRDSLANADRLAKVDPSSPSDQKNLWVALNKLGDALMAQLNLAEALKTFQDGLASADRMAKADPNNAEWQRELGLSSQRVGIVLTAQGKVTEALQYFRDSLAHAEQMAMADPDNSLRRGELLAAYYNLGRTQLKNGMRDDALKTYKDALSFSEKLAATDPINADWQSDLSTPLMISIGDVLLAQGSLSDGLANYQKVLDIREKLAWDDPSSAERQSDVAAIYDKIGDAQLKDDTRDEALTNYQKSLAIRHHLAEADPANTRWQRDEAASLSSIGSVKLASGDTAGALVAYEESLGIARHLAETDQNNTEWQQTLVVSLEDIGNAKTSSGDSAGVLAAYEESLAIRRRLAQDDPSSADRQSDVANTYDKIGDAQLKDDKRDEALTNYQESLAIRRHLAETDPNNVQLQTDLVAGLYKLATATTGDEKDVAIKEGVKILDPLASAGRLTVDQKSWKDQFLVLRDASKRGWLGVGVENVPESMTPSLQLENTKGALVAMVVSDSPAGRSGFRVGDVIASFNDTTVQDASGFMNLLAETDIGQTATITVLRDGKPQLLRLTLGELKVPSSPEAETSSTDAPTESDTPDQAADAKPSGSPTEDLDRLFDEYFKDLVASQR